MRISSLTIARNSLSIASVKLSSYSKHTLAFVGGSGGSHGNGGVSARDLLMSPESSVGTVGDTQYGMQHHEPFSHSEPAALDEARTGRSSPDYAPATGMAGLANLPVLSGGARPSGGGGAIELDPSAIWTPPSTARSESSRGVSARDSKGASSGGGATASGGNADSGPRTRSPKKLRGPSGAFGAAKTPLVGVPQSEDGDTPTSRHISAGWGVDEAWEAAQGSGSKAQASGSARPKRPASAPRDRIERTATVPRCPSMPPHADFSRT